MKTNDLHPKQIPTLRKTIKEELIFSSFSTILSLLKCFTFEIDSDQYTNQVIVTADYFERISRLVYKGKNGQYRKLTAEKYDYEIFVGLAETPEEVSDEIKRFGTAVEDEKLIFKMVRQISDLVCPMMACMEEQAFVSEYAFAIDYVIRHKGDLPKPDMGLLFPKNYPEYNYWEGTIVEKIEKYSL